MRSFTVTIPDEHAEKLLCALHSFSGAETVEIGLPDPELERKAQQLMASPPPGSALEAIMRRRKEYGPVPELDEMDFDRHQLVGR